MRIEKRRVVYGSLIGTGTFVGGVLLIWLTTSVDAIEGITGWRAALWIFLQSNGIALDPSVSGVLNTGVLPTLPELRIRWAFPYLLVTVGTILTMTGVSGTARFKYLAENGVAVLYGYLGSGLIALLESGARPAIAGAAGLLLFLLVAMYVGSTVAEKFLKGLPFIGVAPLGLIIVFGMIIVVVGVAIIDAILPMVALGIAGTATGVGLYWSARHAPR